MTWERERGLKWIGITLALVAVAFGLFALLLDHPPFFIDEEALRARLEKFGEGLTGTLGIIRFPDGSRLDLVRYGVPIGVAALMLPLAWIKLAPLLHDRLFASFQRDLLRPLDAIGDDGGLAWKLGDEGPRRQGWDRLTGWCAALVTDRKRFGGYETSYKLAIVAGRAGSGKTRLSQEFGLHLAHKGAYRPPLRRTRWRHATGAWLRRALPLARPRPGDPWDAGMVNQAGSGRNWDEYCRDLEKWQPRRPTLILLDDPTADEVQRVHGALSRDRKGQFHHPVVLLIANQTIPQGCGMVFDAEKQRWNFHGNPAEPPPIMLPVESWFDPGQVRTLAFESGALNDKPEALKKSVREGALHRITGGNPLLVVLAIEWLRHHDGLDGMTGETLRAERARRIIMALQEAGIADRDGFLELLVATLAGGARKDDLERALRTAGIADRSLMLRLSEEQLQPFFPSDPVAIGAGGQRQMHLPPMRPELIVAAFFDAVCAKYLLQEREVRQLVHAACYLDLARTLRMVRRVPPSSTLGAALAAIDPAGIPGLDPLQWAVVQAETAMFIELGELESWTASQQSERIARADAAVEGIADPRLREAFCRHVAALVANRAAEYDGGRRLLPAMALRYAHRAAQPDAVQLPIGFWIDLYADLQGVLWTEEQDTTGPFDGPIRAVASDPDGMDRALDLVQRAWNLGHFLKSEISPLLDGLSTAVGRHSANRELFVVLRIYRASAQNRVEASGRLARWLARAADGGDNQEMRSLYAVRGLAGAALAWHWLLGSCDLARRLADRAAAIAKRFPDSLAMQIEAARARSGEAYSWSETGDGKEAEAASEAALLVSDMAAGRFVDSRELQEEVAKARLHEASAWSYRPEGAGAEAAREAVGHLAEIAGRFADSAAIQQALVHALAQETVSWSRRSGEVATAAVQIAADRLTPIASRYPWSERIFDKVAKVRVSEALAVAKAPGGAGAEAADAVAHICGDIAARFPESEDIRTKAIGTYCCAAAAWKERPAGSGGDKARIAADRATALGTAIPDTVGAHRDVVGARCHEAGAWARRPLGAGAAAAGVAADRAAEIAGRFPAALDIQRLAAETRSFEAYAWGQRPDGAGAEAARKAADRACKIADRYADSFEVQRCAAVARRYEVFAWSQCPDGSAVEAARAAIDEVIAIAERFRESPEMWRHVAEAHRYETKIWADNPSPDAARHAGMAAERVVEIANRFPASRDIAVEAVKARHAEAVIWARRPRGAGADASRRAVLSCREISARFPGDGEMPPYVTHAEGACRLAFEARKSADPEDI